jgi:hypothetical protein
LNHICAQVSQKCSALLHELTDDHVTRLVFSCALLSASVPSLYVKAMPVLASRLSRLSEEHVVRVAWSFSEARLFSSDYQLLWAKLNLELSTRLDTFSVSSVVTCLWAQAQATAAYATEMSLDASVGGNSVTLHDRVLSTLRHVEYSERFSVFSQLASYVLVFNCVLACISRIILLCFLVSYFY